MRLLRSEVFKMSRRPRTYIGFAAFAVINILVMLGLKYGGMAEIADMRAVRQGFEVVGSPANAEFMAWMVVGSPLSGPILIMFLPFFMALVFGEMMAGENTDGTLRMLLARPIRRSSLTIAKFAASVGYGAALVFFLGISAYVIGLIFFGRGGLLATGTLMRPMLAWFGENEGLTRLVLAYALTSIAAITVGMVAFFIGSWLHNALGAIGGAIMLQFTMFIVGEIPWFAPIKNYLFSTHVFVGQQAFLDPVPWGEVRTSLVVLGTYIAVLFAASLLITRRKDILA